MNIFSVVTARLLVALMQQLSDTTVTSLMNSSMRSDTYTTSSLDAPPRGIPEQRVLLVCLFLRSESCPRESRLILLVLHNASTFAACYISQCSYIVTVGTIMCLSRSLTRMWLLSRSDLDYCPCEACTKMGSYDPFFDHRSYLSASQRHIKKSMLPMVPKTLHVFWQHHCDEVRVTEVYRPHLWRYIQLPGQLGSTNRDKGM